MLGNNFFIWKLNLGELQYFWLVKIPPFLKRGFGGCGQGLAADSKHQSNLMNDEDFSSFNFLKLK